MASSSTDVSHAGMEINRLLLISFVELFKSEEFGSAFNARGFEKNTAMRWILTSTLPAARRIVSKMAEKARKRKNPLTDSTINDPEDPTLTELGSRQVYQLFRAALAVHTFAMVDVRVREAFTVTFHDVRCSPSFLNAGSYLQQVLRGPHAANVLFQAVPSVSEVLVWFHCVNVVQHEIVARRMKVKMGYRIGNIIGYVVHCVWNAWRCLIRKMGHTNVSEVLAPYMCYNLATGSYEHLMASDGFAPTAQRQSLLHSQRPGKSGPGFSAEAISRTEDMDKAYRHVSYAFLKKLKDIVSNNALYTMTDEELPQWPLIRALHRQSGEPLPFVFSELDDDAMETLNIPKPVPPPLLVINVEDSTTKRVGRVTTTPTTLLDKSVLFQSVPPTGTSTARPARRSTITPTPRPRKRRRISASCKAADNTAMPSETNTNPEERSNSEEQGTVTRAVKAEVDLVDVVDAEPSNQLHFNAQTKDAYKLLQASLTKYVSFYTAPFHKLLE